MSIFGKIKSLFSNKQNNGSRHFGKIIGFSLVALFNVAAVTVATIAWFCFDNGDSVIDMVVGDLDVEINKVTAHKYVYPYYKNSTEFVNYESTGTIKQFVLEDHVSTFEETDYDDIKITSDDATVYLDSSEVGTSTTNASLASSTNVCIPTPISPETVYKPDFRYYIIGDNIFNGVNNSWTLEDGYAFAQRTDVSTNVSAVLDNIVISAGCSFALLEVTQPTTNNYIYNYFPINNISEQKSPFRAIDSDGDNVKDSLLCLRSGIYSFIYSKEEIDGELVNKLEIKLHTRNSGTRKDISIITNNLFDPTKVTIDYAGGSVNKTDPQTLPYYGRIEDYLPVAIYDQNTALVLDVELKINNANPIDVALQVERTKITDTTYGTNNSIFNLEQKYADTAYNLEGYVDTANQNLLRASDFYNFYALFTKTPYASSSALWDGMHQVCNSSMQKFSNVEVDEDGETPLYDSVVNCTLNLKESDDSVTIPSVDPESLTDHIYHCYISIEYDYEHSAYFLDKNRLSKTYLLDRDFGFHFFGIQRKET